MTIAELIRSRRLAQGRTVENLARAVDVGSSTLVRIESGSIVQPRPSLLFDLAEVLGIDLPTLRSAFPTAVTARTAAH